MPGDSEAPLVDVLGRVVGLVHGGVRCHIATPGDTLGKLVDRVLERHMVRAGVRAWPRRRGWGLSAEGRDSRSEGSGSRIEERARGRTAAPLAV